MIFYREGIVHFDVIFAVQLFHFVQVEVIPFKEVFGSVAFMATELDLTMPSNPPVSFLPVDQQKAYLTTGITQKKNIII